MRRGCDRLLPFFEGIVKRRRIAATLREPKDDRHADPVANGRSKELFALFTAVAGAPRRILLPGEAQLSAKAGRLLAAGCPLGFPPRTRFAAAGPAEIAAWHPDHPDCLIRLDRSGLTWYRRAAGVVGRIEYPHLGEAG